MGSLTSMTVRFRLPMAMVHYTTLLFGLMTIANGQLKVVNGDFQDHTGLKVENDGWYAGVPIGWSGTGGDYVVLSSGAPGETICNPSQLKNFHQKVGTSTDSFTTHTGWTSRESPCAKPEALQEPVSSTLQKATKRNFRDIDSDP